MSSDWIEEQALRFEGFTDDQIKQIKVTIPDAQALVALVQKNQVVINQAVGLVNKLIPTINMILTVMKGRLT